MSTTSADKRRITYVVHNLNPGGTERLVVDMSLALIDRYKMNVVCIDEPGLWAAELRKNDIPVDCLWRQPGLDTSLPVKLARLFSRYRTELIHAHQCTPWVYSALSRLVHRVPKLLLEEHGRFYPETDSWKRKVFNRFVTSKLTHRFVAVSEDVRRRLIRYEGVPEAAGIRVIYNGTKAALRSSNHQLGELRRQFGFEPDHFVVGTVGRFDPIKNLPMLVGSIASTVESHPNLRGLLVGDGPLFAQIRELVHQRKLDDVITLAGYRRDAADLVGCMDLFVLPSFSEGTSMALLEAIAAGTPVAVTDVGGNPEIVKNNVSGWVIPSGAEGQLGAAISAAMENPQRGREYATEGQSRLRANFSFDRMMDQYRALYVEMLD